MKVTEHSAVFYFRTNTNLLKEWAGTFMNLKLTFFQPQEIKVTKIGWLNKWAGHTDIRYERLFKETLAQ